MGGNAEMMRARDRGGGDATAARQGRQRSHRKLERGVGEAIGGVDDQRSRPRLPAARHGMTIHLAGACLRGVARHAPQTMARLTIRLGEDQRLGNADCIVGACRGRAESPSDRGLQLVHGQRYSGAHVGSSKMGRAHPSS